MNPEFIIVDGCIFNTSEIKFIQQKDVTGIRIHWMSGGASDFELDYGKVAAEVAKLRS